MPHTPKKSPKKDKSASDNTAHDQFNILYVIEHFKQSLLDDGDVDLKQYIMAYRELNKMFAVFGRLFSFVQSDVAEKETILQNYLEGQQKDKYESVSKMMDYELEMKSTTCLHPPSGSRTLLRLHRALEFVIRFVQSIHKAGEHDKMSTVARTAYDDTLAHFHPWIIRKGVHVAVYTLPTRKQLIYDLSHTEPSSEDTNRILSEVVEQGRLVYDRCQTLYAKNKMLELP